MTDESQATLNDRVVGLDAELSDFCKEFGLSAREGEILRLLAAGISTAEDIGNQLRISHYTVNNHLKTMFDKSGTPNKTEILALFLRRVLMRLNHAKMFVKRPRVLVVDDEPEIVEMISEYLVGRGLKVSGFTDPREALAAASDQGFDFVVSDIDMPKIDGMQLLQEIRRKNRQQPMVLFITGKPYYSADKSLDLGAVAFIEKPLSLNKLFMTIMENFVEGAAERNRLLAVDSRAPVVVDKTYQLDSASVGFGGAFLAFVPGASEADPERKLRTGDVLEFNFELAGTGLPIRARGEVIWRRDSAGVGFVPGLGVKFLGLEIAAREALDDYVRSNKIGSFIPLGRDGIGQPRN